MPDRPFVVVVGGPNGAGKTTLSRAVVFQVFGLVEFVNADVIAQGLSGFDPGRSAFAAGRLMLDRLRHLSSRRASFAFETTLASRSFAARLKSLAQRQYQVHLIFVWLHSPQLAIRRVRARTRKGGHSVPDDVVIRRYPRSIANFIRLYLPLADSWRAYDNSDAEPRLIAWGERHGEARVALPSIWSRLHATAGSDPRDRGSSP